MRKRLLVGAIAAVAIGVAVYFLSQPKEGTVDWHKMEYLKALERLSGNTWKDKLVRVYRRVARQPWSAVQKESDARAFNHHLASLVRLGYLQKAQVSVTNTPPMIAMRAGYLGREAPGEALRHFIAISTKTTEGERIVQIIAPTSDLPTIEAAIRQADVPESK